MIKNIQIYQQNELGYTALICASKKGHKEIVQMLEAKEKESKAKNYF